MNTPNEPLTREAQPQVNEQRRRLAKGGLAAPIVVGTLLSRPVLGAAPHNCTISGQLSGNVSTHQQGVCSTLGVPPATWVDKESNLIRKNAQFAAVGFTDTYWAKNGSNKLIPPGEAPDVKATLQQVLANDVQPSNPPANIDLGRAAVASYFNAIEFAPDFPLTGAQVVAMFNATIGGGTYDPTGVNWNAGQVLAYFQSLYQ